MAKKLHMYTIVVDSGFAPHLNNGVLSLACCAGPTREHTETGTYVMGVSAASMEGVKKHLPIYLMRVTEKITFEEYFENPKFEGRVDNIYKKEGENYMRTTEKSTIFDNRYEEEHKEGKDPEKSEYVLLSDDFYYFGDMCNENKLHQKMEKLCDKVDFSYTAGGNYKKVTDEDVIDDLLNFFEDNYKKGKLGDPNHEPDEECCSSCEQSDIPQKCG